MKRIKIKFCGFTDFEDIKEAINLEINYIGIVIDFPKSPRSVSFEESLMLFRAAKKLNQNVKLVAVTVDMYHVRLNFLANSDLVDVIQLHGNESIELCEHIRFKKEVWKAFKVENSNDFIERIKEYNKVTDAILLDASSLKDKEENNTQVYDDLNLFKILKQKGHTLILAGGLNPLNINKLGQQLEPEIVDVSSGIEISFGKKDKTKMQLFIKNLYE